MGIFGTQHNSSRSSQSQFSLTKSEESCCTKTDFKHFREKKEDHQLFSDSNAVEIIAVATNDKIQEDRESLTFSDNTAQSDFFTGYQISDNFLSLVARRLQAEIEVAH